jgi:hypothetical protein
MGHPHPISNPAGPQWSGTRGGPPAIREWIERNRSLTDRGDYRPGVPADPPPGPAAPAVLPVAFIVRQ